MGAAQPAGKGTASNLIYNLRGWPRADEAEAPGGGAVAELGLGEGQTTGRQTSAL